MSMLLWLGLGIAYAWSVWSLGRIGASEEPSARSDAWSPGPRVLVHGEARRREAAL